MKYELIIEFLQSFFFRITRELRANWWGNESDRKSRILTQKYIYMKFKLKYRSRLKRTWQVLYCY